MFWSIAIHAHCLFGGATLHRAALFATHRGDHALAERLFERGGERYRDEIQVQPLARLRVHQEIARLCAVQASPRDPERCLEVERALSRLERIESLEPPVELMDAQALLASWLKNDRAVAESLEGPPCDRAG
jgi:hypothetical protein